MNNHLSKYQTFLSHNSADGALVEELARRLEKDSISCFLDRWHLIPGEAWQPALEAGLSDSASCVVFIGPSGLGPWQSEEMRVAIDRRVTDQDAQFRVIPVLLPGAIRERRSQLPDFFQAATWVEFRQSLDEQDSYHRLKQGILGLAPGPAPGTALLEGDCPYRGLDKFDDREEDARLFFGRDPDIDWMLEQLGKDFGTPRESRFLAVVGASGSGKSSLVRSGLIPAIRRGASRTGKRITESENWPVITMRPGPDPLSSLAIALHGESSTQTVVGDALDFARKLQEDERRLHVTSEMAVKNLGSDDCRLLLVVDQFEETFTGRPDANDSIRKTFIDNLVYAAKQPGGKTIVLLTVRSDFYGSCAENPQLAVLLGENQYAVTALDELELEDAILRPAQLCGLELQDGLLELLKHDMREQPAGALPLLQQTLLMLWHRRQGRRMTVEAYQAIGGLKGALETHANEVFSGLSEAEQTVCQQVFLRLTQPGHGTEDTRRNVTSKELEPLDPNQNVLRRLTDARLITIEKDENDPAHTKTEIAHEALIGGWSRLRGWLDENREHRIRHHHLIRAAKEWHDGTGDILRGHRLNNAIELRKSMGGWLAPLEQQYIRKSLFWSRFRRATWLTSAVGAVLLIGLALRSEFKAALSSQAAQFAEERANAEEEMRVATEAWASAANDSIATMGDALKGLPGGGLERARAHEKVAEIYQGLSEQFPDDVSAQLRFGQWLLELGEAYLATHNTESALTRFNAAADFFASQLESIETGHPYARYFQLELSHARIAVGIAGQDQAALSQVLTQEVATLRDLKTSAPEDASVRRRLGYALLNSAKMLPLIESIDALEESIAEYEFVVARGNRIEDYDALSDARRHLAARFLAVSRVNDARVQREASVADYERAADKWSAHPRYKLGVAVSALRLGELQHRLGLSTTARELLSRAWELLNSSELPADDDSKLACLETLGRVQTDLGEYEASSASLLLANAGFQDRYDRSSSDLDGLRLAIGLSALGDSHHGLDNPQAVEHFESAKHLLQKLLDSELQIYARSALAHVHGKLGLVLWDRGALKTALPELERAQIAWHELIQDDNSPPHIHDYAKFLAYCPVSEFRERHIEVAVLHAKQLVEKQQDNPDYQHLLGATLYRTGRLQDSIEALNVAAQKRGGGNDADHLFLAMSHWKKEDHKQASLSYQNAHQWMTGNRPENLQMKRLFAEADALGIARAIAK